MESDLPKGFVVAGFPLELSRLKMDKKRKHDDDDIDLEDEFINALKASDPKVIVLRNTHKDKDTTKVKHCIYYGCNLPTGSNIPSTMRALADMMESQLRFEPIMFKYKTEIFKLHDYNQPLFRQCRLIAITEDLMV